MSPYDNPIVVSSFPPKKAAPAKTTTKPAATKPAAARTATSAASKTTTTTKTASKMSTTKQESFHVPLIINGEHMRSSSELQFDVIQSASGKTVWTASGADEELTQKAIESSAEAFKTWRKTTVSERRALFMKALEIVRKREDEIAQVMMGETSCTEMWAKAVNLAMGTGMLEEIGSLASLAVEGSIPAPINNDQLSLVFREPYGVVVGIVPHNAPFVLAVRAIGFPIVCGNTAILKASELSPRTHHLLATIFHEAGFPPGVLNVIQHSRENGPKIIQQLVSHPAVRKINFTGSTAIGKIIAETAGKHMKPVLMELGGKAPAIVLDDADLEHAAQEVITGAFIHHGQVCMATERVIVHSAIAAEFTEKLKAVAAKFPADVAISESGAIKPETLVKAAVSSGARVIFGDHSRKGSAFSPTIITDVTKDMEIHDTESFGPTLVVYTVNSADEAVEVANDTKYGLSSSVFTKDVGKGIAIARRLDAAACHINNMTVHDSGFHPHGGNKDSGYGRFGYKWGIDEFTTTKYVSVNMKGK